MNRKSKDDINYYWILNVKFAKNDFKRAHCSCEQQCVGKDMTIIFVIAAKKMMDNDG